MQLIHLFDSYYFREATPKEINAFFNENVEKVFKEDIYMDAHEWLTKEEKQKRKGLSDLIENRYRFRILVLKNEEVIGWHFGWQIDEEQYYMCNTGLLEEYQGKGIYSALLPKLIEIFKEKGFQKIISMHHASNNAILVPKLKAGFLVTGFDINEKFGLRVVLSYIFNEKRLNAYKFRTGALRPDEEMKKYL
jgi:ribosomal protein S18 acetylase RimI-like enzyme